LTYQVLKQLPLTKSNTLPLGRPLPNCRIYILDQNLQPLPIGEQGELFIGGIGVARGYLNQPELTTEKFMKDPFNSNGGRMYRSGDHARHLEDGNIEFCGRIDDQVKISGYRVELGEIGKRLCEHRGIQDAIVLAEESDTGNKQLIAYLIPKQLEQPLWEYKSLHILPDNSVVAHLNRSETDYIYKEIFELQAYLRHGITIKNGDVILDAGSNIGLFTVFASRLAQDLSVYCFEPNPSAFACLKANAEAWGKSVKCLPIGLSNENKTAELTFFEGLSLLSGFYADPETEREVVKNYVFNQESEAAGNARMADDIGELISSRLHEKREIAQLKTLSSVIAEEHLNRIDLLKINVEKSELDVLRGIEPEDWIRIRQLVIEVDLETNVKPIIDLLERHGFEVLVEQDPLLRKTELCYIYAIRPSAKGTGLIQSESGDSHVQLIPAMNERILTPIALRKFLKERLPQYMVPSVFVLMEKFPLTSNGKIDRNALPKITKEIFRPIQEFVRPQTEMEKALGSLWTELLKVENIGINDSFFDLGGQSLQAIKVVSRIRDIFGVDLPIQALFENSTISELAQAVREMKLSSENVNRIERFGQNGPRPLSYSQEQLWILDRMSPGRPVYNIVDVITFSGKYNSVAMRKALDELVRRHEVLRTTFSEIDGHPMQIVLPTIELEFSETDLSELSKGERESEWACVIRHQGRKPFDLSQSPLFRATMVHFSSQEHRMLFTIHHIISDEWSMELIHQEVSRLYDAFTQGRPSPLSEQKIQYSDFALWQREWLKGEALQNQISYWKRELAGAPPVLDLRTDRPRPAIQSFRGATEIFHLSESMMGELKALGRQEHATLFMILATTFAVLLNRYSSQNDILLGTPITGRTHSETESLIGNFLNTIILRTQFRDNPSFRTLLKEIRERLLGAYAHSDLPFEHLVTELKPERDLSRTPLFQVMFVLHNSEGVSRVSKISGSNELETGTSKFDLTLFFSESENRLDGMFEYDTDLFESQTIRRMCGHYIALVGAILLDPDRLLSGLSFITEAERRQQLTEWNGEKMDYPKEILAHHLFESQVERTPKRIALRAGGAEFSYVELDELANRLAQVLRTRGGARGNRIGICLERGSDMLAVVLAVLKTGASYVPLDPSFPKERLKYMAEDAKLTLLVTRSSLADFFDISTDCLLLLDVEVDIIKSAPITRLTENGRE
ncbi:MAG: FkbM family methyltransferase, partial [Nitrospirae bacterium]|nr:FkbM family methyltransferase [Nitrospirota bacterium]